MNHTNSGQKAGTFNIVFRYISQYLQKLSSLQALETFWKSFESFYEAVSFLNLTFRKKSTRSLFFEQKVGILWLFTFSHLFPHILKHTANDLKTFRILSKSQATERKKCFWGKCLLSFRCSKDWRTLFWCTLSEDGYSLVFAAVNFVRGHDDAQKLEHEPPPFASKSTKLFITIF